MKAKEYFGGDDVDEAKDAYEKMERIEKERQRALRRQAADRRWLDRQTKRAQALAQQHHVDEQEGWRLLRQEEELDRALDWFSQRLEVHQVAALEAEAAGIGAKPWLAGQADDEQRIEHKSAPIALKAAPSSPLSASGRFTGLAAVIGGQPDSYGDVIQPGAFKASIAEARARGRPFLFPLLYQHEPTRVIGGVASAEERPGGLYIECQLDLDTRDGKEAFSLISGGYLDGLSIGYVTVKDAYRGSIRELREIRLLECSIVTFPANSGAQVARVA